MACKPADQQRDGVAPRNRMWKRIRVLGVGVQFTVRELATDAAAHAESVRSFLSGLVAAKIVGQIPSPTRGAPALYWLARDTGQETPRVREDGAPVTQGLAREYMWRTMRTMGVPFTPDELASEASTDQITV